MSKIGWTPEMLKYRKAFKWCLACGCKDNDKPQIFRGEDWCSDLCRKALVAAGLA